MVVNRLGVLSMGKVMGCVYGLMGLIPACFMLMFLAISSALPPGNNNNLPAGVGLGLGIAAFIFLPVAYGIMGFIGGVLTSAIYNLIASFIGGIEVELLPGPDQPYLPGTATPMR